MNCDIHLLSLDIDTAGSWGARLWLEPMTLALLTVELAQSLVGQTVKHLPTMPETWVRSLGQEDPLEKEMATRCSILTWETPWTKKKERNPMDRGAWPGHSPWGHKELDTTE